MKQRQSPKTKEKEEKKKKSSSSEPLCVCAPPGGDVVHSAPQQTTLIFILIIRLEFIQHETGFLKKSDYIEDINKPNERMESRSFIVACTQMHHPSNNIKPAVMTIQMKRC